jgi:RNA polymerase sigma factor (sigma-70 family)
VARGGGTIRHDLDVAAPEPALDLLALDNALTALAGVDVRYTRVMELRYFAGCSLPEIAELTGRSLATVKRDWAYARAWLFSEIRRTRG